MLIRGNIQIYMTEMDGDSVKELIEPQKTASLIV